MKCFVLISCHAQSDIGVVLSQPITWEECNALAQASHIACAIWSLHTGRIMDWDRMRDWASPRPSFDIMDYARMRYQGRPWR